MQNSFKIDQFLQKILVVHFTVHNFYQALILKQEKYLANCQQNNKSETGSSSSRVTLVVKLLRFLTVKQLGSPCCYFHLMYILYLLIQFVVDGTSDDLDEPIKSVFMDPGVCKKYNLCSINSINWCRIMVQIAHYFYAYFQVLPGIHCLAKVL